MIGIFLESSEELGLLVNRYKDIPEETEKFLNKVDQDMSGRLEGNLSDHLTRYRNTVRGIMKSPEPINPRTLKSTRKIVTDVRSKVEKLVPMLRKSRETYEAIEANENKGTATQDNSLRWVERVIVDTLNLCDQDINLLSLVDKVYYRKVYESDCSRMMTDDYMEDIMEADINDCQAGVSFDQIYRSYFENDSTTEAILSKKTDATDKSGKNEEKKDDKKDDKKDKQQLDFGEITSEIKDDDNEKYYPIFPMSVAYNYGPLYTFMAPIIHTVTNGDEYTHSFMSFDPEFKTILTFGGKGLEYMTVEDYEAFKYSKSVYVSVVWLTKQEINDIRKTIKDYYEHPNDVRFSLINFFTMMMGKAKREDKSHCCSAFLGYLLNVANKKNLTKDYSMTRPEDITLLPRAYYVGTFKNLDDLNNKREDFKKKINKLYEDNIDDIREYNNTIPRVMLTDNIKRPKELKKFYQTVAV